MPESKGLGFRVRCRLYFLFGGGGGGLWFRV